MAVTTIAVGVLAAADPGSPGAEPALTFTRLTPGQIAMVGWAEDLFRQAGLVLPPIDFTRYPTADPCMGRSGIARYEHGRGRIGFCTQDSGPREQLLFLHEMAHAWDRRSLSDERRDAFRRLRGIAEWRSADLPWPDLGAEQAAEIITWGLMDRPVWIVTIPHTRCDELLAGFQTLTGRAPLHGYTDKCERYGA